MRVAIETSPSSPANGTYDHPDDWEYEYDEEDYDLDDGAQGAAHLWVWALPVQGGCCSHPNCDPTAAASPLGRAGSGFSVKRVAPTVGRGYGRQGDRAFSTPPGGSFGGG